MTDKKPDTNDQALAPPAMPTDILAYDPTELKGNFHRAARASQIAEMVLNNLPKWTGKHARVPGNNPIAEVTRHGTLQVTNEITMHDLQDFVTWVCQHAGLRVSALQECGHPVSARAVVPRDGVGVFGLTAEEATDQPTHCTMCTDIETMRRQMADMLERLEQAKADRDGLADRNRRQAEMLQQNARELDAAGTAMADLLAAAKTRKRKTKARPAKAGKGKAKRSPQRTQRSRRKAKA